MKIKIKLKDLYNIIEQNINPDIQKVANMLNQLFPLKGMERNMSVSQARQVAAQQQPIQQLRLKLASDLVALRQLILNRNDITDLDVTYNIIQLLKRYQSVNVGLSQPVNVDIDVKDNENVRTILKNIFGDIKLAQRQPGNQLKQLIKT